MQKLISMKTTMFVLLLPILGCITLDSCQQQSEAATTTAALVPASAGPVLHVIDTDFSKGRLGQRHEIALDDVARFHGHLCDGLVAGFLAFDLAAKELFPEGVVDRTNLRLISIAAPCISDVAAYCGGGRIQYNTLWIDPGLKGFFVLQRLDNGQAVRVGFKPGVKPAIIGQMGNKAVARQLSPCGLDSLRALEDEFSAHMLASEPEDLFELEHLDSVKWNPPYVYPFVKTDVLNKDMPPCTAQ